MIVAKKGIYSGKDNLFEIFHSVEDPATDVAFPH